MSPQLKALLDGFQNGDLTERALSYLLAMRVWDVLESGQLRLS